MTPQNVLVTGSSSNVDRYLDTVVGDEFGPRTLQVQFRARRKVKVAPFGRQHLGDAAADALRAAGDQRRLSVQLQIHVAAPPR